MSFLGGSSSSSSSGDVKTAVVQQLQQEAAMTNARALIQVCDEVLNLAISPFVWVFAFLLPAEIFVFILPPIL